MPFTKAATDLGEFMDRHNLTGSAVAKALGVTKGIVSQWRSGRARPEDLLRRVLHRWTRGAVRAEDWLTAEEQEAIAAVIPFRPSRKAIPQKAAA